MAECESERARERESERASEKYGKQHSTLTEVLRTDILLANAFLRKCEGLTEVLFPVSIAARG
jgi:hypothetical protein